MGKGKGPNGTWVALACVVLLASTSCDPPRRSPGGKSSARALVTAVSTTARPPG